jgi:hypothetical protein
MLTRYFRLAGLTLLFGLFLTPAAHAGARIAVQIGVPAPVAIAPVPLAPAPYALAPAPYAGFIWQPGYYVSAGFGRRWVPGAWVRPSYGRPGWSYGRPGWSYGRRGRR